MERHYVVNWIGITIAGMILIAWQIVINHIPTDLRPWFAIILLVAVVLLIANGIALLKGYLFDVLGWFNKRAAGDYQTSLEQTRLEVELFREVQNVIKLDPSLIDRMEQARAIIVRHAYPDEPREVFQAGETQVPVDFVEKWLTHVANHNAPAQREFDHNEHWSDGVLERQYHDILIQYCIKLGLIEAASGPYRARLLVSEDKFKRHFGVMEDEE